MDITRRNFLGSLAISGTLAKRNASGKQTVDRMALVSRHCPAIDRLDPLAPLSVGNGEFAFTADITGLQTFPEAYDREMPLCTMAQWGWHTTPPSPGIDPRDFRLTQFETYGRQVGYPIGSDGQRELYNWLRENPHRLHLGQIGLKLTGRAGKEAVPSDLVGIEQRLNLWTGILSSRFIFDGRPVSVRTAVHPDLDLLAVEIESPLIVSGELNVQMAFPYGSPEMKAADWRRPEQHRSTLSHTGRRCAIHRILDRDEYRVAIEWDGAAELATAEAHRFILKPERGANRFSFVVHFSPRRIPQPLPSSGRSFAASANRWRTFWTSGAAVELAESRDPRALELERRVVLSQYLTAIQCAGSLPPQETGLTVNSWYGKYHLEMHWWHAAHFALWNRLPMLEKSLSWYGHILPRAREWAKFQGYTGARWPKMTAPDGRDSPSPVGPLLIWQQPHPIFYAELCYLHRPSRQTLHRYREVVSASAEFMASFAVLDPKSNRYVLGPPVIPAQENHPPRETWNPTFELAYWAYGLRTAQRWRERLGMKRHPDWDRVLARLSPLPVRDGIYLAHENCPPTFTERNRDHPSMLAALGVLPGDGLGIGLDRETMRRTLTKVMREWRWDETWGWDYPMTAMTAARLGETGIAIDALMMQTPKNRYLPNGHNWQRANLPCYLPGNGGLLYAVALMAAGWRGAPRTHAPGFPSDDSWTVRAEGFKPWLLGNL